MDLFFLESADSTPLTKTFTKNPDDSLTKSSYPPVRDFTSSQVQVSTLAEFYAALRHNALQHHCLLKGRLTKPLVAESRAGSTNTDDPTSFVVLDIDGDNLTDPDEFIRTALPECFHSVSYIFQHSSSSGITGDGLRGHLFFWLSAPAPAPLLKTYLTQINLDNPHLSAQLTLNATGMGLRYVLDRTTCQNDKLIYIAPPVLHGLDDPLDERISLVVKDHDTLTLNLTGLNEALNQTHTETRIAELRAEAGLPKKKFRFRLDNDTQILANPDQAVITEAYRARGFVYVNINGGDSDGYYFPEDNPRILYNFKGEPPVLLQDLDTSYYRRAAEAASSASSSLSFLVFRDFSTDTYYNGIYDPERDILLKMAKSGSKDRLEDFLAQYKRPMPDTVEDWDFGFWPDQDFVLDTSQRRINRFVKSEYLRHPTLSAVVPPLFLRVFTHALGDCPIALERFLNWFACKVQFRIKLGTAWIIHGVEGTGKGLIYHFAFVPLLGAAHCAIRELADLDDQFNDWQAPTLIVNINEARLGDSPTASKAMNHIKNLITEPTGRIRAMRTGQVEIPLYNDFLFTSNHHDALAISADDRRFNVAPRQESPIELSDEERAHLPELLKAELPALAGYLLNRSADLALAQTPLVNEAKAIMRTQSQNSIDQFAHAILTGDLSYFAIELNAQPPADSLVAFAEFTPVVKNWISHANSHITSAVSRDDLLKVYRYLQNNRGVEAHKFARLLAHHEIVLKPIRVNDKVCRGIRIDWNATPEDLAEWSRHFDDNVIPLRAVQ